MPFFNEALNQKPENKKSSHLESTSLEEHEYNMQLLSKTIEYLKAYKKSNEELKRYFNGNKPNTDAKKQTLQQADKYLNSAYASCVELSRLTAPSRDQNKDTYQKARDQVAEMIRLFITYESASRPRPTLIGSKIENTNTVLRKLVSYFEEDQPRYRKLMEDIRNTKKFGDVVTAMQAEIESREESFASLSSQPK
jgi:hypothetical protein